MVKLGPWGFGDITAVVTLGSQGDIRVVVTLGLRIVVTLGHDGDKIHYGRGDIRIVVTLGP